MQLKDHRVHHHVEQDFKDLAAKIGFRVERFGLKHQILMFLFVFYAAVLGVRGLVLIHDPNPFLLGVELHHIHYGLTLLIIASLYMLFVQWDKFKHFIFLIVSAVAIGLVMDEIVAMSAYMRTLQEYWTTLFSALVLGAIIGLAMWIMWEEVNLAKRRALKKKAR